ncbi:MAG: SurA N-terminal domain-containing protein [Pseudomonadota bacterium]|nr:SurA N-terminal domain-containing protein [Pseudomonadota bacterium]
MMESLRNFLTGPRLLIVVLVCALPFVFLGTSSLGTTFNTSFGNINGEDVKEIDLQIASNSTVQKFKSVYGEEFDFDMLDEEFKADAIKQELIIQKVLYSGAKSMGLINQSTELKIKKEIIKSPRFQVDGEFNENVYEAQVNSSGFTKESYIEIMTGLSASELYRSSLNAVNFVTDQELYQLASLLEKSTNIDFIKINFDNLKSEIVNTEDEIKSFYEANEILFFSDEQKSFKYLVLDQSNYSELIEVPDSYLEDGYQNYLNEFVNAAQTRISHIMIDKNNYETREDAFDSINKIEELIKNGENFSELASVYSEDIVTSDIGGDLEYFDKDIFPIEFDEAIKDLELNEVSKIVELEDTFHILKITEKNLSKPLSADEVKDNLLAELIETESYALMLDEFTNLEDMIFNNDSFDQISIASSKTVYTSDLYTKNNFDFESNNQAIKDYLFSPNTIIGEPFSVDLGDRIIIMALDKLIEPQLQSLESIKDSVINMITNSKAKEKMNLLATEIQSFSNDDEKNKFIDAYNYVESDSFVDVKRYSSLLPREVLNKVFINQADTIISEDASNGDKYIVTIKKFNQPLETDIQNIIEEYNTFSEEIFVTRMNQIVNNDIFESARVNLNNLIF